VFVNTVDTEIGGAEKIFRLRYNISYLSHDLVSLKKYERNAARRAFALSAGDRTVVSFTAIIFEFSVLKKNLHSQSNTIRSDEKLKSI
jgi:hypothetical protein